MKTVPKIVTVIGIIFIITIAGVMLTYHSEIPATTAPLIQETPTTSISRSEIIKPTFTITHQSSITKSEFKSTQIVYKVIEVEDGDSITLEGNIYVRLLGINAPEKGYPFNEEAKNRLSSLIENKDVRLESDFEDKDQYDRLLRYVFIGEILVNTQLVKEGLATVFMESGLQYKEQLVEAENYAKLHGLGLWKKDTTYANYIYLVTFHYNADGNDNENLNDEYIIIENKGDIPIDMTGWTIKDEANHIFTFPEFFLKPKQKVTIYTGQGTDTSDSLYWGNTSSAVWDNDGDTLYLRNDDGYLIFSHEY